MENPKLLRRLKKLLALAEGGVGGEKDNAQRMLENLLTKHNLSLSDLTDDVKERHWFRYNKGRFYDRLMSQIIYSICGKTDEWVNKYKRYQVGVDCSEYEAAQIRILYEAYYKPMDEALELAYDAFLQVNSVFPEKDNDSKQDDSDIDMKYLMRLSMAMSSMDKVEVREALPESI